MPCKPAAALRAGLSSSLSRGGSTISKFAGGPVSFAGALAAGRNDSYEFYFPWVDVAMDVLCSVLSKRVDEMVEQGLVEEARWFYAPGGDYSRGIRRLHPDTLDRTIFYHTK